MRWSLNNRVDKLERSCRKGKPRVFVAVTEDGGLSYRVLGRAYSTAEFAKFQKENANSKLHIVEIVDPP